MRPKKRRRPSHQVPGLGERLRRLRENRDLTVRALAIAAMVPASTISRIENRIGDVGTSGISRIAAALKVSVDYLVAGVALGPPIDEPLLSGLGTRKERAVAARILRLLADQIDARTEKP